MKIYILNSRDWTVLTTKKRITPKISNRLYGVDGVPKTDHEIYVWSAKKAYNIFSFAFFIVSVRLYYDRVRISAVLNRHLLTYWKQQ